jgi:hypothetical protein
MVQGWKGLREKRDSAPRMELHPGTSVLGKAASLLTQRELWMKWLLQAALQDPN